MDSGCDCETSSNQKNKTHKSIKALQIRKTIEKIDELDDVGLPISPPTEASDQTVEVDGACLPIETDQIVGDKDVGLPISLQKEASDQTVEQYEGYIQPSPDKANKLSSRTAKKHLTLIKGIIM